MSIDYKKYEGHTQGQWDMIDNTNKEMVTAGLDEDGCFKYVGISFDHIWDNDASPETMANYKLCLDSSLLLAECKRLEAQLKGLIDAIRHTVLEVPNELEDSIKEAEEALK